MALVKAFRLSLQPARLRAYRLLRPKTFATRTHSKTSSNDYCRNLVRQHDYEAFLSSKLYPRRYQSGYYALRAFYIELATIREAVSQATLGAGRFVFWRNTIKDVFNNRPPQHPIAIALHETMHQSQLSPYHFQRMIDAREEELLSPMHLTIESMTAHAESTASTFFYLVLSLLSQQSTTLSHAASHLGVVHSFTTYLRAFPFHVRNGAIIIPAEITARHGVNQQEVLVKCETSKELEDAVFEFATIANDNLMTARAMFKDTGGKVPQEVIPLFSAAIPSSAILSRLEKVNFNVFDPSLQVRDWRLPWRVWRSYYKRTF